VKVITSIYHPFWGTEQFMRSCGLLGLEVINVWPAGQGYTGNGDVIRRIYETVSSLDEPIVYADGADSFFLRKIRIPTDYVLYSTEKACWPDRRLEAQYTDRQTPWCYINGGGYCGPAKLVAEYMQRFGLSTLSGDKNGQFEQHQAYFQAVKEGFPVRLDQHCLEFQTVAFADPADLWVIDGMVRNNRTLSIPALLHGNGRTPMDWVYRLR
jgi:hypothetical protein